MYRTSITTRYYSIINQRVKMHKINSPQSVNIKYMRLSPHYRTN